MKKNKILSILLTFIISISVISGLFGCTNKPFTVTFVGGDGAVLISGETVQTVSDASQLQPPVFEKEGHVFDGWSKILGKIRRDTTVKAVWYSGYVAVLGRRYYDENRNNKEITVGYDVKRGDTVKIPYGSKIGALGVLFPKPIIGDNEYEFLCWELVLRNGTKHQLTSNTIFNDDLFVGFGMTQEDAFKERGNTITINPVLTTENTSGGIWGPLD